MNNLTVVLNSAGVRELLKSAEMQAACEAQAVQIRARCGTGYVSDTYMGRNRVNCAVYADSPAAERDNLSNNTILRSLK